MSESMQDPEAAVTAALDGIPGAPEGAVRNLGSARAGETLPLDDLGYSDEAETLLDKDGRRERLHTAMDGLRAGTLRTVDAATARARIEKRIREPGSDRAESPEQRSPDQALPVLYRMIGYHPPEHGALSCQS